MPNHVTQILTAHGHDAFERMQGYFTDFDEVGEFNGKRNQWRAFDFNKLIPRPESVSKVVENGADRYIPFLMNVDQAFLLWEHLRRGHFAKEKALPGWQGFSSMRDGWMERELRKAVGDDVIDNAHAMIRAFAETGHKGWYDWCIAKWGTKWNAYSCGDLQSGDEQASVKFDTAWAVPEPVLAELAKREPTLAFDYLAIDEGWNFWVRGRAVGGVFSFDDLKCSREDTDFIAAHVTIYGREPEPEEVEEDDTSVAP